MSIVTLDLITKENVMVAKEKGGEKVEKITLDIKELCVLLGISQTTAYAMVREGSIPHFRMKGKILFNRIVIEEWTRQQSLQKEVVNR